jgi:excisionase family DNA binding protein
MAMRKNDYTKSSVQSFNDPRTFGLLKVAYSVKETISLLSIGRTTFYELVDRGDLKITKLGRKSLVYAIDLAALLTQLRAGRAQEIYRASKHNSGTDDG